jgi:hypothetical protein
VEKTFEEEVAGFSFLKKFLKKGFTNFIIVDILTLVSKKFQGG